MSRDFTISLVVQCNDVGGMTVGDGLKDFSSTVQSNPFEIHYAQAYWASDAERSTLETLLFREKRFILEKYRIYDISWISLQNIKYNFVVIFNEILYAIFFKNKDPDTRNKNKGKKKRTPIIYLQHRRYSKYVCIDTRKIKCILVSGRTLVSVKLEDVWTLSTWSIILLHSKLMIALHINSIILFFQWTSSLLSRKTSRRPGGKNFYE